MTAHGIDERGSTMTTKTKPTTKEPALHRFTVICWCDDQNQTTADWVMAPTIESAEQAPVILERIEYAIVVATVPGHVKIYSSRD